MHFSRLINAKPNDHLTLRVYEFGDLYRMQFHVSSTNKPSAKLAKELVKEGLCFIIRG